MKASVFVIAEQTLMHSLQFISADNNQLRVNMMKAGSIEDTELCLGLFRTLTLGTFVRRMD